MRFPRPWVQTDEFLKILSNCLKKPIWKDMFEYFEPLTTICQFESIWAFISGQKWMKRAEIVQRVKC